MRRNLDIATLRSLVAVVDAGGVTRAANRLHLTQSAVSMQIKRLEESLDLPLLDRSRRGVAPTAAGEQLLGYARRMLAMNDEAVDRMVAPGYEGEVSFGVPCDLVYPKAPEILRRFDNDFPRVHVNFVSSYSASLIDGFRRGLHDVIITTEDHPAQEAEMIAEARLHWHGAIGGRAWQKRPLPFATAQDCAFRPMAIAALNRAEVDWRATVETENEDAAVAAVMADLCIMALLEGAYEDRLERIEHGGKLPDLPTVAVSMYVAGDSDNAPLARELARYVRDAFGR